MTCRHVLDLIDAGSTADYPADHLRAAWAHARGCPTCGPALEASTALTRELARLRDTEPPAHFAAAVTARIARLDTPHRVIGDAAPARPASVADWWPAAIASVGGVMAAVTFVALLPPGVWTTRGFEALWAGWIGVDLFVQPPSPGELIVLAGGVVLFVVGLFVSRDVAPRAP